jgi:hypothetical protein
MNSANDLTELVALASSSLRPRLLNGKLFPSPFASNARTMMMILKLWIIMKHFVDCLIFCSLLSLISQVSWRTLTDHDLGSRILCLKERGTPEPLLKVHQCFELQCIPDTSPSSTEKRVASLFALATEINRASL